MTWLSADICTFGLRRIISLLRAGLGFRRSIGLWLLRLAANAASSRASASVERHDSGLDVHACSDTAMAIIPWKLVCCHVSPISKFPGLTDGYLTGLGP